MDARLLFPNDYLGAADLQERDVTLTISRLVQEELRTDKGNEEKWVLFFKEMEDRHAKDKKRRNKRLVLNKTNAASIAKVWGNETNDWTGRPITLFPTTCMAFGKPADCIRIREKKPKAKPSSSAADQIPDEDPPADPPPPAVSENPCTRTPECGLDEGHPGECHP